ncbi:MAG TPA: hypothetical protein PKM48_13475, partial [Parvularculaceae bacterium]|nr:hypothetical protein [Parvularculaceae bacterium]
AVFAVHLSKSRAVSQRRRLIDLGMTRAHSSRLKNVFSFGFAPIWRNHGRKSERALTSSLQIALPAHSGERVA